MTKVFFSTAAFFFLLGDLLFICFSKLFEYLLYRSDIAGNWFDEKRRRCLDKIRKPIRPNSRRIL